MLEPDELGRVGTTTAQSASKAVDRIIERLAERVSAALIDDMRAAFTNSATVPAMVLEILGSNPIARNSDARREYQLNLTKSAKADAAALGAKASLEVFQSEVETATDRLMTQLAEFKQRSNLSMAIDAKNTYQSVVTELLPQVQGGTLGYEEAVQKACKKLSERGVCIINYASGRRDQPDVAVRRHIQTQLRQAATASTLSACERLGVVLVEVSSHVGARPTHQEWQGQVYGLSGPVVVDGVKYKGFKESGAYDGLQEPNCRHSVAPYVPGRARRWSATPDKDAGLDPKESYNATQRQRYNERKIRAAKREALACREAGVDDTAARLRLGNAQRAQRQLLNQNKWLARRTERESVSGGQGIRGITTKPIYSGALNSSNDPSGLRRKLHAEKYYEAVRNRNAKNEIAKVAKSSGLSETDIEHVYNHIFIAEHALNNGSEVVLERFSPDYDMAQSWQRLRSGENIQEHDLTLLKHELAEEGYMRGGLSYEEAHIKACKDGYNYEKDLQEWKAKNNLE